MKKRSALFERNKIEELNIITNFQPLYSVTEKKYIGVEALSRADYKGDFLSAGQLFSIPSNDNEKLSLNMKCIYSAIYTFKKQNYSDEYTMFLNFDSSILDSGLIEEEHFLSVDQIDVNPNQIVIELIESNVGDFDLLINFVKFYRNLGFLIALDDVGAGYSGLDRLVKIKPDIIKIDRSLVNGVSKEYHKREVCRSLIELTHNIGALSLSEGVETLDDAIECQQLGTDLIQGYFFSKPLSRLPSPYDSSDQGNQLVSAWKTKVEFKQKILTHNIQSIKSRASEIAASLEKKDSSEVDRILLAYLDCSSDIECMYILNEWGIQVSETYLNSEVSRKTHSLFQPARMGTDHSLKHYFQKRLKNQKYYISDPYISRATGNFCRTISCSWHDGAASEYYLCLDISHSY